MNGLEEAERILAFEAALVEERNKTSASQRLAGFRNQLLLFLDKSRLDDTEKQIIDTRRAALSTAERDYIKRQARTLGVEFAGV